MTSPTTILTPEQYLTVLRRDAARMAELAADHLDAGVPACPGWTVRDALVHTGSVYSHKVACMRLPEGPQTESDWDQGPTEGESPEQWFRERFDELARQLTDRGPDAPSYTWHDDHKTVAFWFRRMAHETAVHRVDVESGADAVSPVDDDLALDGIDEVLDWMLVHWHDDEVGPDAPGRGTVAVRTGDHIWRVTLTPDGVELDREPGRADAVLSGEASELFLWLWGRRPDSAVSREGDDDLLSGFRERLRAVTQ